MTTAETVNEAGVVPDDGETLSQETLPVLAVNAPLGLALTAIVCVPGEAPPAVVENDNDDGVTVRVDGAEPTVNVTGIVSVCPLPVTVTEPV